MTNAEVFFISRSLQNCSSLRTTIQLTKGIRKVYLADALVGTIIFLAILILEYPRIRTSWPREWHPERSSSDLMLEKDMLVK